MAGARIRNLVANLPYSMRAAIEGYVDAVAVALPEIESEAGVRIGDRIDDFLSIVAIRKIWASINRQFWTMSDCIEIASRSSGEFESPRLSVRGFKIGRDEISVNSEPFAESRQLRDSFEKLISDLDIHALVTESASLADIARQMFERTE